MGNLYSYYTTNKQIKLCDEYIGDKEFNIHIKIHSFDSFNLSEITEYLQYLNPINSETLDKTIILKFNGAKKDISMRSDLSGDIICSIATDITKYCITNSICDPYYVEVSIYI